MLDILLNRRWGILMIMADIDLLWRNFSQNLHQRQQAYFIGLYRVTTTDLAKKIDGPGEVFCTRHHYVRHTFEQEMRDIDDNGWYRLTLTKLFSTFTPTTTGILHRKSLQVLYKRHSQKSRALEKYFGYDIITLDLLLNRRWGILMIMADID